jgi:hypothetical protein
MRRSMRTNSRELAVDVDGVQPRDEVDENVVDTLGNLLQEGGSDLLVGGELAEVDGDEKLLGLLVDIANIDTALVGEEDPIALSENVSFRSGDDWRDRRSHDEKSRNTTAQEIKRW